MKHWFCVSNYRAIAALYFSVKISKSRSQFQGSVHDKCKSNLIHFRSSFVCAIHISCSTLYDNSSLTLWHGISKRNSYGCLSITGCSRKGYGPSCGLCSILDGWAGNLLFYGRIRPNYSIFDAEILQNLLIKNIEAFIVKRITYLFYIIAIYLLLHIKRHFFIFFQEFSQVFYTIKTNTNHSKWTVIRNPNKYCVLIFQTLLLACSSEKSYIFSDRKHRNGILKLNAFQKINFELSKITT